MFAPVVIGILTVVFILLFAAVVQVLGTNLGYKVNFTFIAFLLLLKGLA